MNFRISGGCLQPSCMKRTFTMACSFCKENDAVLLDLVHLSEAKITTPEAVLEELKENGCVWVNRNGSICSGSTTDSCLAYVYGSSAEITLNNETCSSEFDFFCFHKNDKVYTGQPKDFCYNVLYLINFSATISLVGLTTGLLIYLCKRETKPVKPSAREATAVYQRQNQDASEVETMSDLPHVNISDNHNVPGLYHVTHPRPPRYSYPKANVRQSKHQYLKLNADGNRASEDDDQEEMVAPAADNVV